MWIDIVSSLVCDRNPGPLLVLVWEPNQEDSAGFLYWKLTWKLDCGTVWHYDAMSIDKIQ